MILCLIGVVIGTLPFLYVYAAIIVAWPLGSLMKLGFWREADSEEGGSVFEFWPEFDLLGLGLFILVVLFVGAIVRRVYQSSRPRTVKNPTYQGVDASADRPESLISILERSPQRMLLAFRGAKRDSASTYSQKLVFGMLALPLGLFLGDALSNGLGEAILGAAPSSARLLLLLCSVGPGVWLLSLGFRRLVTLSRLDERLLLDFTTKEIWLVDVGVASVDPEPLYGFCQLKHVQLSHHQSKTGQPVGQLSLIKQGDDSETVFLTSSDLEGVRSAGKRLAQKFDADFREPSNG